LDRTGKKRGRSTLPKEEARRRYVEIGELVALEQIRKDAKLLDGGATAIGPFARIDANAVAARDGKTRGAVTNLFGSQAAFQAETMALALNADQWIEQVKFPAPADFATAEAWFDALRAGQAERGPVHGAKPTVDDGFLWALWLSTIPYGLWSEHVSRPSMKEYVQWLRRLERILAQALDHFGLGLRAGTTINDFACALASLIEGIWLNQCLTKHHPCDPAAPISTLLHRSGRLLWQGAVEGAGR
jgi:hypothetical protein